MGKEEWVEVRGWGETRSGLRTGLLTSIPSAFVPPHQNGSCCSNGDGM